MKKIVLACGSGIATSTAVAQKVTDLLNKNGYEGQFNIVQCAIAEAKSQCEGADLLIATTVAAACPAGTLVAMMAEKCNKGARLAAELVSFQTLLSVITMPLVVGLAETLA